MISDEVKTIVRTSKHISGWFEDEAAMLFGWIDEIQKENGISGDLFEIGCHHGKSAVCLAAMADTDRERLGLCDLFADQEENVSASGSGDLDILYRNLAAAREAGLDVRVFSQNSMSLRAEDIGRGLRFFHIDGGHNSGEALSDLRLAADTLLPEGVVALDDAFSAGWPGVTEALIRFLDERGDFCAVVSGFNKLLLTPKSSASMYQDAMRMEDRRKAYMVDAPWQMKELPFHGHPLQIYYLPAHYEARRFAFHARKFYRSHAWVHSPVFAPFAAIVKAVVQRGEPD